MVEARELVTICRQIGGMLEAGVDILRVTRVVRAQTTNPRLLEAFGEIEHSLRVGASVSEALERVPDVFSPFAVSLVQEGEAKRDIAGAFLRIADFLQQEEATAPIFAPRPVGMAGSSNDVAESVPATLTSEGVQELVEHVQTALVRALVLFTVLLVALAGVWWSVEAGLIGRRWQNVALCGVTALFTAGAALWLQRQRAAGRPLGARLKPSKQKQTASEAEILGENATFADEVIFSPQRGRGAVMPPRNTSLPSVGAVVASLNGASEAGNSPLGHTSPRPSGRNGSAPDAPFSGTPLATPDALAVAKQIARKRYGAMADAADVMSVQPDIYEMDLADTLGKNEMGTDKPHPEGTAPPPQGNGTAGMNGTKPARHESEADFD